MKTQSTQTQATFANAQPNAMMNANAQPTFGRIKKQLCAAVVGLSMVFAAGCGMPTEHQQSLESIGQSDAPKPAVMFDAQRTGTLAYQPRLRVAKLIPSLETDDPRAANTTTKTIADASKHTASLDPALSPVEPKPLILSKTTQTKTMALPKNACFSGLRVLDESAQENDGQIRLVLPLQLKWDVKPAQAGQPVHIYLFFDRLNQAELVEVEGEQPTHIERINDNTWRLTFTPHAEPGQQFKGMVFQSQTQRVRLGICYNVAEPTQP